MHRDTTRPRETQRVHSIPGEPAPRRPSPQDNRTHHPIHAHAHIAKAEDSPTTTTKADGTTADNFRDPPPRRIMKSGRAPPHQPSHLARDTIRAAATKSEGGHGGEPADRQKATSTAPAGPTIAACTPAARQRSPYGRSCHRGVTIIQNGHRTTTILKVAATRRRPGRPWKGIPAQRHPREALRVHGDPTRRLSTDRQEGRDQRHLRKPYARSGKNACRGDPEAFTDGNEKGQLSWPFTKSG